MGDILVIIYLIWEQPFMDKRDFYLEVFNELSILVASYNLIFFTDAYDDPDFQYKVGYFLISITVFNIAVNILIILLGTVKSVKLLLELFCYWLNKTFRKKKDRGNKVTPFSKSLKTEDTGEH
mmetsp:Transcript_12135/g.11984  ORF Transcript_12135/g.11984 Transcript_12135/m.11984 type:complete len:123 (+) Transcript_12135:161-529(+)